MCKGVYFCHCTQAVGSQGDQINNYLWHGSNNVVLFDFFFSLFFELFLGGFFLVGFFFFLTVRSENSPIIYHPILEKTPHNIKSRLKKAKLFKNTGRT